MPSGKELLVFLFNDFLLFSTAKAPTNNWQSQLFERKANMQLKLYRMVGGWDVLDDNWSLFCISAHILNRHHDRQRISGWSINVFDCHKSLRKTDSIENTADEHSVGLTTRVTWPATMVRSHRSSTLWVRAISNAVTELRALEPLTSTESRLLANTEDDDEDDSKSAVARLILVVQSAHNLMPSIPTLERLRA